MCRSCQQPGQWEVIPGNGNQMNQVIPLGDIAPHYLSNCPCGVIYKFIRPETMETALGIVTHRSYDDRERFIDQDHQL